MLDMELLIKKAGILIEALPYIQRLSGKTVVIKYGGNAMINEELKDSVMEDITLLKFIGLNPIVVHGGGPDISSALKTYGIESKFINGLRVTDDETIKVAQMVLVGKTNKEIVAGINRKGGKAVGISGIDGALLECEKLYAEVDGERADIGHVGEIVKVNDELLEHLTNDEYIPVVAPIGTDKNGNNYNINADSAAGAIACALKAEKLMLLTDVDGVKDAGGNVIFEINTPTVRKLINDGIIDGGMIPKALGCVKAINSGVKRVHIIDGRIPHSILLEIFTDEGIGTMITK